MDVMEKLAVIENTKVLYAILYRNMGVGFQFYTGPVPLSQRPPAEFRKYLKIETYHPSFEQAVGAEYSRLEEDK